MVDLLAPPTAGDALAELERELKMREGCYPAWVRKGTLKPERAEAQISRLRKAIEIVRAATQ